MNHKTSKLAAGYLVLYLSIIVPAQTGGNYTVTESVIAGGGGQSSTGGAFSLDGTIGQAAAGGAMSGSSFAVTSGFWNFSPSAPAALGIEGDVASRPNGDNFIFSDDVVQVQRFSIGLDLPYQANELQRADSAPFATRGDGLIQSADVVQAQRYQIGLNVQQNAAGPSAPGDVPLTEDFDEKSTERNLNLPSKIKTETAAAAPREVRVESVSTSAGQQIVVNIRADTIGDESAYGFRLNFNSSLLTLTGRMAGIPGSSQLCNDTVSGQITCSVSGFPANQPGSSTPDIGEIPAGNNQILSKLTFTVAANAPAGAIPLTLSAANASNDAAQNLTPITATSGTVNVAAPTAAQVSIGGRVLTADGRGIRNAKINLTDSNGNTRTATSTGFGHFRFDDVAAGETYILEVKSKRFLFNLQVISTNSDLTEVNFVALP